MTIKEKLEKQRDELAVLITQMSLYENYPGKHICDLVKSGWNNCYEAHTRLLLESGEDKFDSKELLEMVGLDPELACGAGKEINKQFVLIGQWVSAKSQLKLAALRTTVDEFHIENNRLKSVLAMVIESMTCATSGDPFGPKHEDDLCLKCKLKKKNEGKP